jgi:AraC family transcriptional regulator
MNLPQNPHTAPAVEVLRKAVGVAPEIQGNKAGGTAAASAYVWRTPRLSTYELGSADEVILALHTGGSRNVRTRVRGGWSDDISLPGHLHLIPNGVATAYKPEGWLEFASIHFSRDRLGALAERDGSKILVPHRFAFHDQFASGCISALFDELRAPREFGSLFVDSLLDALSLHLMRPSAPVPSRIEARETLSPGILNRVRDRIDASLESGISLDELAAEAGLSRFHFARAFRDATGQPPHGYLTQCRIERAKALLLNTELSLADIALAVGFSSQSHFSTTFRGRVGQTPRSFRLQR